MRNALALEHLAEQFTLLNRDRADQNRLLTRVALLDFLDRRAVFAHLGAINRIRIVDTGNRPVGRNLDDVQTVNLTELVFLGQRRTGHAGQLFVQTEVVLERDGRQCLVLTLNLDMLLGLNRLMQTVRVTASEHQTAGELVDDNNLVIADDIVDILLHDAVCADRLIDMMRQRRVFRIGQIVDMEVLLRLLLSVRAEHRSICLFVDDIVRTQLRENLLILLRDRTVLGRILLVLLQLLENALALRLDVDLGVRFLDAVALQAGYKGICLRIQIGGLVALSGNNQRGARLIDQDGVHLVDNRKCMSALYLILLIDRHVVAQIVKAELIVRTVGDIRLVHRLAILRRDIMNNQTYLESEEAVDLSHPLAVSLCQIVVDRDNMYALSGQRIEVYRQSRHKCLAFTGLHLGDASLMQDDAADDLYTVVTHTQHAVRRLSHGRKRLRQQRIQRLTVRITLLELRRLGAQFLIRELAVLVLQRIDLVGNRTDLLQLMLAVRSEYFFQ